MGIPALYARIFGYSAEEMIGSSILKLIPEHLHSDEKAIIESIRAGQRVEHFETVRLTKAGRSLDVSVTVSPVKDERGRVIGASKILRDISGRKRIEQSLLQAEKIAATGRMAATIAHEINNPLEAVMNLLYLLRPMITNPDGINYLGSAEDELGRVSHIAKETLGFYLHQIDFFGIRIQAHKGETSAGDLPKTAKLEIRLIQTFDDLQRTLGEGLCQEDEVSEGRQTIIDFVHGRPDEPACQSKLVIPSKIFFACFELRPQRNREAREASP